MYYLKRTFSSSSSSLQTHLNEPLIQKTFFKSSTRDGFANRSGRDMKYTDIEVLCEQKRLKEAVQLLEHIDKPSVSIYATLLKLCAQQRALEEGERVHAHTKRCGFVPGVFISNRILEMYAKCDRIVSAQKVFDEMHERDLCSWNVLISGYANVGRVDDARKLFDEMPERDNFSWTAMISGYVRHDWPKEALELYRIMQRNENFKCNKFTISSALAASSAIPCLNLGREIHGHIVRTGLDSEAVVWAALSDMYGKCGSIKEARHIFDKTLHKDVVSWTAMIDRYFGDGSREEGFALFSK